MGHCPHIDCCSDSVCTLTNTGSNVARINSVETAPVTPPETWFLSFVALLGQMNNNVMVIYCRNDRRLAEY